MNLKEAFRYQNFLDGLMSNIRAAMNVPTNLLQEERNHLRSKAIHDGQDEHETVEIVDRISPDQCVELAMQIICEREKLTKAIDAAKSSLAGDVGDVDAAIEANKYRQAIAQQIRTMLRYKSGKRMERGTGYTFNSEGNQVPYVYDVEVTISELFDRSKMKSTMQKLMDDADRTSTKIDEAIVNTQVNYKPLWDVNSAFEDIISK